MVRNHALHIYYIIISQTNFYFFNYIVAGRSEQLGISPPPEWMGSRRQHRPVPNNITNKEVKGRGKKPCPPHFLHHYLTNIFFNYIVAGRSAQLVISLPPEWMGSQQQHRPIPNSITNKDVKGRGKKPCPPRIIHHYFTNNFFWFHPHNWGYLRPQNECEAGDTIALSPTTLPRRQ